MYFDFIFSETVRIFGESLQVETTLFCQKKTLKKKKKKNFSFIKQMVS